MALTDADEKAKVIDIYGIALETGEGAFPTADTPLTVYRADGDIDEKYLDSEYHSPYVLGSGAIMNWGMAGKRDGKHELVMIGTHTLTDPDNVWTEWTGS